MFNCHHAMRRFAGLALIAALGMPSAATASFVQFSLAAGCQLRQDDNLSASVPSTERRQTTANGVTVCAASMPLMAFERVFKLCAVSHIDVPAASGGHSCGVVYGPVDVEFRFRHAAGRQPPACSFACLVNEAQ